MAIKFWISEIKFSDDTSLQFANDDIVVFVGPNNAGKSASLREMATLLKSKAQKGKVIRDINIKKEGEKTELFTLLEKSSTKNYDNPNQIFYQGLGFGIWSGNVESIISNYTNGLGDLVSLFANTLSTEQRLQAANPAPNIKLISDAKQHPIHYLQENDTLEQKFSDYFRQAFGTDLLVHRNAGSEVPLYIGKKPKVEGGEDRISITYIKKMEN